ncbi:hypothetical protein ILUMI_08359 [Ignelater luminosus]|uniref:Clip domain-containing protein n=1 Tax=Ignelater luminosus TaxID=2038154 RepID=A0A8K0D1S5_IGNLU|nr:hypothetical protein ILUMI_08359 [Ignelater luminosus]
MWQIDGKVQMAEPLGRIRRDERSVRMLDETKEIRETGRTVKSDKGTKLCVILRFRQSIKDLGVRIVQRLEARRDSKTKGFDPRDPPGALRLAPSNFIICCLPGHFLHPHTKVEQPTETLPDFVQFDSDNVDNCVTPNGENVSCVPLDNCPILINGVKTLNDAVIDFTKKSVCKTEENAHYVCCGTSSYLKIRPCLTPNQENGKCVELESCPIIFDGVRVLNQTIIDFATKSICRIEGDVRYVCCGTLSYLLPPVHRITSDTSTLNSPITVRTVTATISTNKTESKSPLVSDRKYCGYQHADDRIYNEDDTAIDKFPWVALLIHENDTVKDEQHCLGTLINNRYVVTTAVCVNNTDADAGFKIFSFGCMYAPVTGFPKAYGIYDEDSRHVLVKNK